MSDDPFVELTAYLRQSQRVRELADDLAEIEGDIVRGQRGEDVCDLLEKKMEELLREASDLMVKCRIATTGMRAPRE